MAEVKTCRCDGSGRIPYEIHDDTPIDLGDGTYIAGRHTYGVHLCPCRRDLPPRDGEARMWHDERVQSEVVGFLGNADTAEVIVDTELPVDSDHYVVHRRGNRYFPTMLRLEVSDDSVLMLTEDARKFAAALLRAADAADAVDEPDTDACGHWWPCGECSK